MIFKCLATDYDGTIAHHGSVDPATVDALCRVKESGRKLLLVTGRQIPDLFNVFSEVPMFDRIVAENGAILYEPVTEKVKLLGEGLPEGFAKRLREVGIKSLSVGRVILATQEIYSGLVEKVIEETGVAIDVILNKGELMMLPKGVDKATGLSVALSVFGFSPREVVGVGDAENDGAFLDICGCSVAVANALPWLKERVDWVTKGDHGQGIRELSRALIERDLAGVALQDASR